MKRLLLIIALAFGFNHVFAISYQEARDRALYLTDKMAYELNLTNEQYDNAYRINLDYLMSINNPNDCYSSYWYYRNNDLKYILSSTQFALFTALDYFYHPIRRISNAWYYPITTRYERSFYYFGRPTIYVSYNGRPWTYRRYNTPCPYKTYVYHNHGCGMRDYYHKHHYDRRPNRYDRPHYNPIRRPERPQYGITNSRPDNNKRPNNRPDNNKRNESGRFGHGNSFNGNNYPKPQPVSMTTNGNTNGQTSTTGRPNNQSGQNQHFNSRSERPSARFIR